MELVLARGVQGIDGDFCVKVTALLAHVDIAVCSTGRVFAHMDTGMLCAISFAPAGPLTRARGMECVTQRQDSAHVTLHLILGFFRVNHVLFAPITTSQRIVACLARSMPREPFAATVAPASMASA
jgi:hypothetical protein